MTLLPTPEARLTIVTDGSRTYVVVEVDRDEVDPVARHLARRPEGADRDAESRRLRDAVVNALQLHTLPERIARAIANRETGG